MPAEIVSSVVRLADTKGRGAGVGFAMCNVKMHKELLNTIRGLPEEEQAYALEELLSVVNELLRDLDPKACVLQPKGFCGRFYCGRFERN